MAPSLSLNGTEAGSTLLRGGSLELGAGHDRVEIAAAGASITLLRDGRPGGSDAFGQADIHAGSIHVTGKAGSAGLSAAEGRPGLTLTDRAGKVVAVPPR